MLNINYFGIFILIVVIIIVGARYGFGPVLWIKRSLGRKRAQEGEDRRELIARVQKLLPQANDDNVVFSMYRERSTRGGSKVTVTTDTYYPRVFVVEEDHFWVIPLSYDKRKRTYRLGEPDIVPEEAVKLVRLTGKRGKNLTCTFYLKTETDSAELAMVLSPLCYRENSFHPFNLLQEAACDRALEAAEKLAYKACHLTPEELEADRLKDECSTYGVYAGCSGMLGVMLTPLESITAVSIPFFAALILFGLMIAKKRIPKFSAIVVIVEAVIAYSMLL